MDEYQTKLNFKLDEFQIKALNSIDNKEHVLITAHTGSGKTIIADYGIDKAIREDKLIIYTSPIKALSNQKYEEFGKKYGKDKIGLLTGDNRINSDAKILIMTTEILRNLLMKDNSFNINMDLLGYVVFDEIHYINNEDRGYVWEECLINMPDNIILIMLSATITFPEELSNWISEIKKRKVNLIGNDKRPVPLKHYLYDQEKLINVNKYHDYIVKRQIDEKKNKKLYIDENKYFTKNFLNSLEYLKKENKIPAIYFILNKKRCFQLANLIQTSFLDEEEQKIVLKRWDDLLRKYKELEGNIQYQVIRRLIEMGVSVHHSGIIPIIREAIEKMFSMGFVKILFSTETFSVGLNMPTRTTVFLELDKWDGREKRYLKVDEFKQMSGRAGRRGLDDEGLVLIVLNANLYPNYLIDNLIKGKPNKIISKYRITFNYILNNIYNNINNNNNNINIEENIRSSFYQYQNNNEYEFEENEKIEGILELFLKVEKKIEFGFPINIKRLKILEKQLNEKMKENNLLKKEIEDYLIKREFMEENKEIKKTIDGMIIFLKEEGYLDENNKLTEIGEIAKEFSEINGLLLSKWITSNYLENLSSEKVIRTLSYLIETKEGYVEEDLKKMDNILYNKIIKIRDKLRMIDLPNELGGNLGEYIEDFMNGKNFNELNYTEEGGYFVKQMLRLINLIENIKTVCEKRGLLKLYQLIDIEKEKLLRDIVNNESLYLV